ncbi:MAG TPA: RagB/SusD family nutrient uptake outer membrane protein [Ohtaekwangia sp.]|nr:RagB/SusD family nutrient uptake outer membrane protein [Ohtaekwangia sp.]
MKSKYNRFTGGLFAMLLILSAGCTELNLAPEDKFTDLTYWRSQDQAQGVLNTAYSQMFNGNYFFFNEALSDNAVNGRGDVAGAASISTGSYDPSLGRFNEEWDNKYAGIKSCNILLENIDRVDMEESAKLRMKGEARFIRAYLHFQLMTWFGDVPLLDHDPTLEEALTMTRTPRAEVLNFVLTELDEAATALPANTELATAERGKVTRGAAIALKARALLYEGRWSEVITETEKLINSNAYGSYGLFPNYGALFLPANEYSQEDILSLQYVPQLRTWSEFFDMAPLSAGARLNNLAPTQELVDSYLTLDGLKIDDGGSGYDEENPYVNRDPRLTHTVVYHGYDWQGPNGNHTIYIKPGTDPDEALDEYEVGSSKTITGYYTRKYFDPTHTTGLASGLNLMLIRYADVLLMHAEALMELDQFNADVWNLTIRPIRERAGFTAASALDFDASLDDDELKEVIRNERRVELAMEGLRIFDIRRWQIADEVLNGWAHGAKFDVGSPDNGYIRAQMRTFDPDKHYIWPIPRDERLLNDNLSQNTGWN